MIPAEMAAVQLTGFGDVDKLVFRTDVPVPEPAPDEVLIRVGAAGVNNTDINTRIGWYSKAIDGPTAESTSLDEDADDGGWSDAPLQFPRIQGADACGEIVAVGSGVDTTRIGERVLVRSMQDPLPGAPASLTSAVFGSEIDGGFAQFATTRSSEAIAVRSSWTDIELASMPCAWSTAEGMLHRAAVTNERVLVTGASGGVGSAAIQLAKRRGAHVTAVAGAAKADAVRELGADIVVDRNADLTDVLGENSVDVFMDLVAGPMFAHVAKVVVAGGRYVASGAIGGPLVTLDVRDLYLKDLTLFGSTYQPPEVFENLVGYIERDEIRPVVAATFPLNEIVEAQRAFLAKDFVGKIVLVPPKP